MGDVPARNAEVDFFESLFGIRIRRLHGLFGEHWRKFYQERGVAITPVQGGLLMAIRENPGISQVMLARLMRIEPPTLTEALSPLVGKGLVERSRAPTDGRTFELSLSQAGLQAAAIVETATPVHEGDLLRGLSGEERRQFLHLLDKAIAGSDEAIAAADQNKRAPFNQR